MTEPSNLCQNQLMSSDLTLEDILNAYALGLFPMAESRDDEAFWWFDPPMRGQLDIAALHIPDKLRKSVLRAPYEIRIDTAFAAVIDACAAARSTQAETWINKPIRDIFVSLHQAGFAHSVEAWQDNQLVGGLYGLARGGAFCGESMFSRRTDASKICLVHLCARLWKGGFSVLDTQYVNEHLKQFGCYEIDSATYKVRLGQALTQAGDFQLRGLGHISEGELVFNYLNSRHNGN